MTTKALKIGHAGNGVGLFSRNGDAIDTSLSSMMICPKCHTPLEIQSSFCSFCGANLHRRSGRILIITAIGVMVLIAGAYGYVRYRTGLPPDIAGHPPMPQSSHGVYRNHQSLPPDNEVEAETNHPPIVAAAKLTLEDISGRQILEAPILALSPGWFAFPVRPCIGAAGWHVTLPSGQRLEVVGGILNDADPLGLWQLPPETPRPALALSAWMPDLPLTWYPLNGDSDGERIQVANVQYLGYFAHIALDATNNDPGFFLQDSRLVGWSFGDLLGGGFLWTGSPGADLAAEFYIDDLYRLTFADGKEEALLLALADKGLSDFQRLEALAAAHRLEPRLAVDDTPAHLKPAAIQAVMRELVVTIESQDGAESLLSLFDTATVAAVNSPTLAAELINIAWDQGQYAYALELMEIHDEQGGGPATSFHELQGLRAAIYGDWLKHLIETDDQDKATDVYQEASALYPQDATIHLASVELALADQNWSLAEKRLSQKHYPPELRDKVSRLQQEIADLKGQEGKIVIRFRPGSRTIPVVARLGDGLDQRFVVDTGASLVTVPSATVQQLGIVITGDLPRRLFYSATGIQNAVEVSLPSITLNGWVVRDVRALVVDLPGQPEMGLLGMNYLSNFRMDVNTSEGVVILTPR